MIVNSVKEYIDTLPQRFVADASKGMNATFQFELSGSEAQTFYVQVDDGKMAVHDGASNSPSATIKMDSENYVKMVNGKLSGTMAFMKGQMKVTGNLLLAQKMQAVFPPHK